MAQSQQQGALAALLGGTGQGLQQQAMNPYQTALGAVPAYGNFLNRKSYESPPLTFLQSLRNEIDEWLKL